MARRLVEASHHQKPPLYILVECVVWAGASRVEDMPDEGGNVECLMVGTVEVGALIYNHRFTPEMAKV